MYSFLAHMLEYFELKPEQEKLIAELEYLFKLGFETTESKSDSIIVQTSFGEACFEQKYVSKELKGRQKNVVENLCLYENSDNKKKLNGVSNNRLNVVRMVYQRKYVSGKVPLSFLTMSFLYDDGGFAIHGFLVDDKSLGGYTISAEQISLSDQELGKLIRSILSNGMDSVAEHDILTVCKNLVTIDKQYLLEICYYDANDLLDFLRISGCPVDKQMDRMVSMIKKMGFTPKYSNSVVVENSQMVNLAVKIIEEGTASLLEFFDFAEFARVGDIVRKKRQKS